MTVWIEAPFDSLPVEGYRKQRYWLMAEAFARAGHRVVYWTSDFSHANKRRRSVPDGVAADLPFSLVLLPTPPYRRNVCPARIRSHRAYAAVWGRTALDAVDSGRSARPDLMVISAPPVSTGVVAIRLARRFGARLVVDVQDAWPETFSRLLPRGFGWLGALVFHGMRTAMRRLYCAADLVTGVCDRYGPLVKAYGAREYYRAYLGIDMAIGCGAQRREGGELRLAYVGNLGKSYDLKTVTEGVRRLNAEGRRRVVLEIAGFGGAVPESPFVRFHGMLGADELRELLSACEIGVIPMQSDSFVGIPNKLGEYAAAGLKVVSSLTGETEDLIARYGCGATYRAGDAESFAQAVKSVAEIPGEAALALAKAELAADRIYPDYVRRVAELCQPHERPHPRTPQPGPTR